MSKIQKHEVIEKIYPVTKAKHTLHFKVYVLACPPPPINSHSYKVYVLACLHATELSFHWNVFFHIYFLCFYNIFIWKFSIYKWKDSLQDFHISLTAWDRHPPAPPPPPINGQCPLIHTKIIYRRPLTFVSSLVQWITQLLDGEILYILNDFILSCNNINMLFNLQYIAPSISYTYDST